MGAEGLQNGRGLGRTETIEFLALGSGDGFQFSDALMNFGCLKTVNGEADGK